MEVNKTEKSPPSTEAEAASVAEILIDTVEEAMSLTGCAVVNKCADSTTS